MHCAGQPLWQPSGRDIDLIRRSWSDDFDFLYSLGTDIYAFIFESAPQARHLFPEMIAAGDDWREADAFPAQALKFVQACCTCHGHYTPVPFR